MEPVWGMNDLLPREATPPGNGAPRSTNGISTAVSSRDEPGHGGITAAKPTAYVMGSGQVLATQQPDRAAPQIKPRPNPTAPQDAEDRQRGPTSGHSACFDIFKALRMAPGAR